MSNRVSKNWRFARRAWALAAPYWSSEERWQARILLLSVVALTLGLVYLTVQYNEWNRSFFEAIQDKDFESFGPLLIRFSILAGLFILGAVFRRYLMQMLQMRWRLWLTRQFLDRWLDKQVYYRLEVAGGPADNPDQRIADDLRMFAFNSLDLVFGLLSSVVTLVSFVSILWVISGPLPVTIGDVQLRDPGLHGVGRAGVRHRRQRADACYRSTADRPELSAAARRGRPPLRTGSAARERRGRRAVRR